MLSGAVETVERYFLDSVSGSSDADVEFGASRGLHDSLATIVSSCVPGQPLSAGDIRLSASSDSGSREDNGREKSFALKMLLILTKKSEEEFQPYFSGLASLGVSLEKVYLRVQQCRNLALCKNTICESNTLLPALPPYSSSSMKVHRVSWGSRDHGNKGNNHDWQTMWTLYLNHLLYDQPVITSSSHIQMGVQPNTSEGQPEVLVSEECLLEVHDDAHTTTNHNGDHDTNKNNSSSSISSSNSNKCILLIGSAMARNVLFLSALLSNWYILLRHACKVNMISTTLTAIGTSPDRSGRHAITLSWFVSATFMQQGHVLVRCALASESPMSSFVPFQTCLGPLSYSALVALDMPGFVYAVVERTRQICCDDDVASVWRLVLTSTGKLPSLLQYVCGSDISTTTISMEALLTAVFMVCGSKCLTFRRKRGAGEDKKMSLALRKEWTLSSEHLQRLLVDSSIESVHQRIESYNQNYANYNIQKARSSSSFEVANGDNGGQVGAPIAMEESKPDAENNDVESILVRYLCRNATFDEQLSVSQQTQSQEVHTLQAMFLLSSVASLLSSSTSNTSCLVLVDTVCSLFLQQMTRESDEEQQAMLYLEIFFALILAEIECVERGTPKQGTSGEIYDVHPHRPLLRALSAHCDNNVNSKDHRLSGEVLAEAEAMQCTAAAIELLYRNASSTAQRALLNRMRSLSS